MDGNGGWPNVSSKVEASAYYGVSDFTVGATEFQHHTGKVVVKLLRNGKEKRTSTSRRAPSTTCRRRIPRCYLSTVKVTISYRSHNRSKWRRRITVQV